jgi:integrase
MATRALERVELLQMLEACALCFEPLSAKKYYTLFYIMACTALRIGGARTLAVGDVRDGEGNVRGRVHLKEEHAKGRIIRRRGVEDVFRVLNEAGLLDKAQAQRVAATMQLEAPARTTRRARDIVIPQDCRAVIGEWLDFSGLRNAPATAYLFPPAWKGNGVGGEHTRLDCTRPICDKTARKAVDKLKKALQLPEGVSTHSFRKYAGTKAYERSGNDVMVASALLGHRQITTTQIYLRLNEAKLTDVLMQGI